MARLRRGVLGVGLAAAVGLAATAASGAPEATGAPAGDRLPPTAPDDGGATARILALFGELSRIPRCSGAEQRAAEWLAGWARERGLTARTDARGNVVVAVGGAKGYERHPPAVLQAHVDMACRKAEGSKHDFARDPIVVARDGDWLRGRDTTLGADDGIGVALALAVASTPGLPHPPLELLFTTGEESGMSGVRALTGDSFGGRRLVSLDSEAGGLVVVGTAGSLRSTIRLPLAFSPLEGGGLRLFQLRIGGLAGGHSGFDIGRNRANANVLLAQLLAGEVPFRLVRFEGGAAADAITATSEAVIALAPAEVGALEARLAEFERESKERYPDEVALAVTLTPVVGGPWAAAPEADSRRAMKMLADFPNGVDAWSKRYAGRPDASSNVGIVRTEDNGLDIVTLQRGSGPDQLAATANAVASVAAGAGATVLRDELYAPWQAKPDSDLFRKTAAAHARLFGEPPKPEVVHAELECGYLAARFPDLDVISIGPTVENVHTVQERVHVPSIARTWRLLTELLADL